MKRVPPPPTTRKTGASLLKPAKFAPPPPPQIVFSTQEQNVQQENSAGPLIGNGNEPIDTNTTNRNKQLENLANKVNLSEPNQKPQIDPTNQGLNFKERNIQDPNLQGFKPKSFQVPKIPPKNKPLKPSQPAKNPTGPTKIAPPKFIQKPQILSTTQQQSTGVTSQPYANTFNNQVEKSHQVDEKPIEYQANVHIAQNKDMLPLIAQNLESQEVNIQYAQTKVPSNAVPVSVNEQQQKLPIILQLIEQKKHVPPVAIKKVTGPKIPPPTKKLPNPPKPILIKAQQNSPQQSSSQKNQQNVVTIPQANLKNPSFVQNLNFDGISPRKQDKPQISRSEQFSQDKKQQIDINKKRIAPPPTKKISMPSPKKIETKIFQNPMNTIKQNTQVLPSEEPPLAQHYQQQISQSIPQDCPNAYNQLQQKLRKLQMMRSRMDQSSEQSYSNNNEDIEEEQEEGSLEEQGQEEQHEQRKEFINIMDERDVIAGEKDLLKGEEFIIGETNYDEMEIKDYHEEELIQQNKDTNVLSDGPIDEQSLLPANSQSDQLTELSVSHNEQDSIIPAPADTIVQSNMSVQQTQHQYLPDEVSNSPIESHGSIPKHHLIHSPIESHGSIPKHHLIHHQPLTNNVLHADKYHSQTNFSSVQANCLKENIEEERNEKEKYEKTEGQVVIDVCEEKKMPKMRDESLVVSRDQDQSIPPTIINSTQNHQSSISFKVNPTNSHQSSHMASIQQLLTQFNIRKSQYLQNLQKLRKNQDKFKKQQRVYQQRIGGLLEEVNHKNLLLLKYTNCPFDRIPNHDRFKEVQEL